MTGINITPDKEELLEEYAAKKIVEFLPAMIFVGVFIIAGVVGNACFSYITDLKSNVHLQRCLFRF